MRALRKDSERKPRGPKVESPDHFTGEFPKVRLSLTPEDIFSSHPSTFSYGRAKHSIPRPTV